MTCLTELKNKILQHKGFFSTAVYGNRSHNETRPVFVLLSLCSIYCFCVAQCVFSLPISLVMTVRKCVLYLIIIIKMKLMILWRITSHFLRNEISPHLKSPWTTPLGIGFVHVPPEKYESHVKIGTCVDMFATLDITMDVDIHYMNRPWHRSSVWIHLSPRDLRPILDSPAGFSPSEQRLVGFQRNGVIWRNFHH